MKTLKSTFLLCLFVISCATISAQTVYVTKTGEKYHLEDCQYLKYSKIETTLQEAQMYYDPCSRCYKVKTIDNSKRATAVQCSGTTQKGNRCKRRTKNTSGRCYQH